MARLLIFLILVALIVVVVRAYRRAKREAAESPAEDEYRVLEQISGGEAHVLIARGSDGTVIGSVPVADEEFGDRYAELIATAEDRAATLNASRHLHGGR